MKALEPKLKEGDRLLLGLKGSHASQLGTDAMRSLFSLKKFDSCLLAKKIEIRPFEDVSSLEFLMQQNRCSAFLLASHTKKRPHNLVLGRAFDGHLLDQVELGVVEGGEAGAAALVERWEGAGSRDGAPLFIFQGDAWSRVEELATLQSLVLDVFGGRAIEQVTLKELDHVTVVTAVEQSVGGAAGASQQKGPNADWVGVIHWRSYSMRLAVTGGKVPRVELCPALPSLDLCLRRVQLASTSLRSAAMKKPAGLVTPSSAPPTLPPAFPHTQTSLTPTPQSMCALPCRATRVPKKKKQPQGEENQKHYQG
jgi:ribosome production factor 2